jgi:hypothetical protein
MICTTAADDPGDEENACHYCVRIRRQDSVNEQTVNHDQEASKQQNSSKSTDSRQSPGGASTSGAAHAQIPTSAAVVLACARGLLTTAAIPGMGSIGAGATVSCTTSIWWPLRDGPSQMGHVSERQRRESGREKLSCESTHRHHSAPTTGAATVTCTRMQSAC